MERDIVMDVILLSGEILVKSGAETFRAEDTMTRIAKSRGYDDARSFVTTTGFVFAYGKDYPAKVVDIKGRSIDLYKIDKVNSISRHLVTGEMEFEEAYEELLEVLNMKHRYPLYLTTLMAGISSGAFIYIYQGKFIDMLPAAIAGALGFLILSLVKKYTGVKFFGEFIASLVVGIIAVICVAINPEFSGDKIIICALMPLVPGVLLTIGVSDLMEGNYLAGTARVVEAVLVAFSIGFAVAGALSLGGKLL